MAKAWHLYTGLSGGLSVANDDVLLRDVDDPVDSVANGTVRRVALSALLGAASLLPGGRLTLETGVPISVTNQTSKSVLYYTPYSHDFLRIYDGSKPLLWQFSEISLTLSGLTSGKNYDVFIFNNDGALTLELSAAWTTNTTRADALAWQAGVGWVKSGAATRLWIGTIRATGATTTEFAFNTTDAPARLFVWNAFNRVTWPVSVEDSTNSWVYTSSTVRQRRGSANNQIEWVAGWANPFAAFLSNVTTRSNTGYYQYCGIGLDSTTAVDGGESGLMDSVNFASVPQVAVSRRGLVSAGYHYLAALEWCDGSAASATWYGGTSRKPFTAELSA